METFWWIRAIDAQKKALLIGPRTIHRLWIGIVLVLIKKREQWEALATTSGLRLQEFSRLQTAAKSFLVARIPFSIIPCFSTLILPFALFACHYQRCTLGEVQDEMRLSALLLHLSVSTLFIIFDYLEFHY